MKELSSILDFSLSDPNKGMLFDVRDGQIYQVVRINNQIWLAENFRYLPSIEKGDLYCNSWVYKNNNDYLDLHYGRLYDWNTAMNIAPEGWKLPSDKDFQELRDFIFKDNNLVEYKEGSYLKSVDGWNYYKNIVNNDKYGFNAKPAGCHNNNYGKFDNNNYFSGFWSATEDSSNYASYWYLNYISEDLYNYSSNDKCYGFSVRLIKYSL